MFPDRFPAADWPLHVTIVPPFETELSAEGVAALLPSVPPIPVTGGARERFGAHRTVPVTVLRASPALHALHTASVDALEAADVVLRDQHHLRDGYRPHVTDQRSGRLHPGEHALLTALCVVARAPHSTRSVAARVPLRP
ncbi:2'-5' RNA ligase family protein [Leifsonia sp. 22587]|uniref:2'-5' RNA ligase family protein n=1 Tax=Leifsonia sp. 22587 TaxID=3453946 RepID=UPI003F83B86A